ncbi:PEP-CTERM sorting domain-containing protein [Nostoc sp. 106C]|uniref:PEP-CTERM sorting domain-containing protein n=1 Tax=Nostoc sp. 106C TaxID=1932667 RepID=UPI000A3CA979|nr:PEP-CTERM sorting domain-containing protein [Nostoc sp. 106C]OUL26172.1 hypothetical protein BV375_21825 [Nostoc sp. 106C]
MRLFPILGFTAVIISASTSVTQAAVVNGGFETGDFTGWTQSGNTGATGVVLSSAEANSGNFSAFLGPVGSLGFLSQFISTTVGQAYQLSYFLKSDGYTPNQFQTIVNGNTFFNQENIKAQDYTKYVYNFVATAASTELKFGFRNDPGYLRLDDVSVSAQSVPEPLTIGGTVLAGGIGLLMKKIKAASQQAKA